MEKDNKNNIKGPYSSVVPKFDFPRLTDELVEQYRNMEVAIYAVQKDRAEPIVIAVKPDRLHIYIEFDGKMQELKYNAFNKDVYSSLIGKYEEKLRNAIPNFTLFGYFYAPNGDEFEQDRIETFNIWDTSRELWLDTKEVNKPDIGKIRMPNMRTTGILWQLYDKMHIITEGKRRVLIRSINDTNLFFLTE